MNLSELADRLTAAASLSTDDAAIRIAGRYQPAAGATSKVFPPSYPIDRERSMYVTEKRYLDSGSDAVLTVLLDAVQSQANRVEHALLHAMRTERLEIPHLQLDYVVDDDGRSIEASLTSLEAPHRSRDAYFRDALAGDVPFDESDAGAALAAASPATARPYVEHAPLDVVLGTWDSHRGRSRPTRFPRVYSSEMLGVDPQSGRRGGGRMDPNVLPKEDSLDLAAWGLEAGKKKTRLSEIGHGMVPPSINPAMHGDEFAAGGGVAVRTIRRDASLSFAGLAAVSLGADAELDRTARGLLAALALLGDRSAFTRPALTLRSGSDLVLEDDTLEWVRRGGEVERLELDLQTARALFDEALERARAAGLVWNGEPVRVTPKPALQAALERALTTVDITENSE